MTEEDLTEPPPLYTVHSLDEADPSEEGIKWRAENKIPQWAWEHNPSIVGGFATKQEAVDAAWVNTRTHRAIGAREQQVRTVAEVEKMLSDAAAHNRKTGVGTQDHEDMLAQVRTVVRNAAPEGSRDYDRELAEIYSCVELGLLGGPLATLGEPKTMERARAALAAAREKWPWLDDVDTASGELAWAPEADGQEGSSA